MKKILKNLEEINDYRIILILIPVLYFIFPIFYYYFAGITDPMPLNHRFIGASMFFIVFILSYFIDFIQHNIEKTTMVVVYLATLQLVYLNYVSNYQLNLALSLIVVIAVANLFFDKDKLKFYLNVAMALLVAITLLLIESSVVSKTGYYFTYIIVAGLTFLINYIKIKEDNKLKEKLDLIIEGTNVGTWEYNIQTGETIYNENWAEMIGYTLEELNPESIETWDVLVHPDDVNKSENRFQKHLKGETDFYKCEKRLKHKDGHWVWVLGQGKLISRTEDGKPLKVIGININISDQKEHEKMIKELNKIAVDFQKLNNEDDICKNTVKVAKDILNFDLCGIVLVEDNQFIPKATSGTVEPEIIPDSLPLDHGIIGKAYKNNQSYIYPDLEVEPDAVPIENNYKSGIAIPIQDIGVFQAVASEKAAFSQQDLELAEILISHTKAALESVYYQKDLEYKSFHDSLTGLYNRRFFEEEMDRLDTKRNLPISIIVADLNGLKLINDSYGHDKGDEALITTADILNEVLRDEDIIARHGGDEFAILLPQTGKETVVKIIKRIKDEVNGFNQKEDIPISFALGSATKTDLDQDIEEVLKAADNNMYQNKLSERNSSKNNIVQALLNTLSAKSDETKDHAIRMTELALKFGEKLNLNNSELNRLSLLATMHDIGKATISENILTKPGSLNEEEWKIIKQHSEKGYKITSSIAELSIIAEDILFHHERWDGEGYPQGLIGDEIPYLSRVITIIDAYDVMTYKRSYGEPISKAEALEEIKNCAGTQFDPDLAEKFIEMMK